MIVFLFCQNRNTVKSWTYFNNLNILLKLLFFLQIILITWGCSGTRVEFMFPMFVVAVVMFTIISFGKEKATCVFEKLLSVILLILVAVCLIQYLNPFLERINGERFIYYKSLEYIEWLPTSVRAEFFEGNAMRALMEISTVLMSSIVCIRLFSDRKFMRMALAFFVINVAFMGVFAIWQCNSGIVIMYNKFYANTDLFGTFYMANAAGAFFNLGLSASIALFAYFVHKKGYKKLYSLVFLLCLFVCSYATYRSDSQGSIILMGLTLLASGLMVLIYVVYKKMLVPFFVLLLFVSASIVAVSLWYILPKDIDVYNPDSSMKYKGISESISSRVKMYVVCKDIISKYPIYGIGGNCCQYVLTKEMVKKQENLSKTHAKSTQHAHSDIIEYAIDFGLIGVVSIFLCFVFWLRAFFKSIPSYESFVLLLGTLVSIIHSCFDMNLHIMSTMIAFVLIAIASIKWGSGRLEKYE